AAGERLLRALRRRLGALAVAELGGVLGALGLGLGLLHLLLQRRGLHLARVRRVAERGRAGGGAVEIDARVGRRGERARARVEIRVRLILDALDRVLVDLLPRLDGAVQALRGDRLG